MNDRIKERIRLLAEEARLLTGWPVGEVEYQKFAELIIQDCVQVCKQEWYDLNNAPDVADESERDIGFRVGEKVGVINCINKINQHFEKKL